MADLGLADLWTGARRPGVEKWVSRMRERPAYQLAFPKGARLTDFLRVTPVRALLSPS
jgi:glutathione S-transferase